MRSDLPFSVISVPAPLFATVLGFVALCMASDLRTRRIPNAITGPAMLAGAAFHVLYGGPAGLLASLGGLALGAAILLPPFAAGGIGGGDVKMMGAVGALLGPHRTLLGLATGLVLGGLVMAVHLARQGRLREKLTAIAVMIGGVAETGSVEPLKLSADAPGAVSLPYSVPLGLGAVTALVLGTP